MRWRTATQAMFGLAAIALLATGCDGDDLSDELDGISMTVVSSELTQPGASQGKADSPTTDLAQYYITPSPSVCTDEWIDFGCDEDFPLTPPEDNCPGDLRIDFDPEVPCPICVEPPEGEPDCANVRRRYLEFIDHNLRETCTNWCETAYDCVPVEIEGCGVSIAFVLRGLVDEEPMHFAEAFGLDNCSVCASDAGGIASFSDQYETACEESQCVLRRRPAGQP